MSRPLTLAAILTAALTTLGSCSTPDADVGTLQRGGGVGPGPIAVDVLFVIDNSGSMSEEQTSLANNFPRFIDALSDLPTGLPDLHIAVVSSNVGISPFQSDGCVANGDDGTFQNTPRGICTPPSGYFISDIAAPDGSGRITNYPDTTTLADTFSCIARLGSGGCGLESHFESMKRALDGHRHENDGFLRNGQNGDPDAFLAVIFVADEDDCSAEDGTVFDPSQTEVTDPLGPFGSFRCAEFGITCAEGNLARTPGSYTACEPRSDETYLYHPSHYVDFLRSVKADPNKIVVAGIVGDPAPVQVELDLDGNPEMAPSCGAGTASTAAPGVRFRWFLDQFGDHAAFTSICADDLSVAITAVGTTVRTAITDFPTLADAGVPPQLDGDESGGCVVAAGTHGRNAAPLLLAGLLALPVVRRARRRVPRKK